MEKVAVLTLPVLSLQFMVSALLQRVRKELGLVAQEQALTVRTNGCVQPVLAYTYRPIDPCTPST